MRVALRNCGVINPEQIEEYIALDGYQAIGKILTEKIPPQQVIQTMLDSGLRGRGGAGFPTGLSGNSQRQTMPIRNMYVVTPTRATRRIHGPFHSGRRPAQRHRSHDHRRLRHRRNAGLHLHPCRVPHRGSPSPDCHQPGENMACSARISSIPALISTLRSASAPAHSCAAKRLRL